MNFPRLMLAGAHSGSGKTTLSLALMTALSRQGIPVLPFKVGPDYIDPGFHQAAAGRPSRNLDSWLLDPQSLVRLFCRSLPSQEALWQEEQKGAQAHVPATEEMSSGGIALIEGVMGLFDGQGTGSLGSTAHVAAQLKAPTVLIVNAEGISLSIAALVAGYTGFRPHAHLKDLHLAAVILNRVSSQTHYTLLRQCIEEHCGVSCLGWFPKNRLPSLKSRHLGLVPAEELDDVHKHLHELADIAEQHLDIPGLLDLARAAPALAYLPSSPLQFGASLPALPGSSPPALPEPAFLPEILSVPSPPGPYDPEISRGRRLRLGLARDKAFSFYYQDNIDLLEELGAEIVPFSPLRDSRLPEGLDGLYLGGGFPEIFAADLEANAAFRAHLTAALEDGLPAYAECGAMLYLCASLRVAAREEGAPAREFSMAGFFPEQAEMTTRLQTFGYCRITLLRDCPLGPAGSTFKAHEFHYARLIQEPVSPVFKARKDDGRSWTGGLCRNNVLAMFPHVHFYSAPELAASFLAACRLRNLQGGGA